MKNLIYQYFDGPDLPGTRASVRSMKEYAERIGAEHLFEQDPNWLKGTYGADFGKYSPHYGCFKIIYDEYFEQYDNILFVDQDVMVVDDLQENIFDLDVGHVGICTEGLQPELRKNQAISGIINNANDERWCQLLKQRWGVDMPRTESGLPKVYNSGVVLWSKAGREHARNNFVKFEEYVTLTRSTNPPLPWFYMCDQPYLHAMLEVAGFDWTEMDPGWNHYVHYKPGTSGDNRPVTDYRNEDTKFVHIQLRGADDWDYDKLHRITNLPVSEWRLNANG